MTTTALKTVTLIQARRTVRLSQRELGDMVGVAQNTVSLWELGRSAIPADRLGALTLRLGLPRGSIDAQQPVAPELSPRGYGSRCGTYSGAVRHVQLREECCERCAQARREYEAGRRVPHPRPPAECGTNRGYHAHRYRSEDACTACRVAHADYESERRAAAEFRDGTS